MQGTDPGLETGPAIIINSISGKLREEHGCPRRSLMTRSSSSCIAAIHSRNYGNDDTTIATNPKAEG
jgi:hypothetical protein